MYRGAPVQPIVMMFDKPRDIADVINGAKFCIDRFMDFGLRKGQSWASHRKPHAMALTTLIRIVPQGSIGLHSFILTHNSSTTH